MRNAFVQFFIEIFFLVQILIALCNSISDNQTLCETYYQKSKQLNCVMHHGRNISTDLKEFLIHQTLCKDANSSDYIQPPAMNLPIRYLNFINCPVRPGVFKNLHFPRIDTFTIVPNNKHPVLKNNTFFGLCSVSVISAKGIGIEIIEPAAFNCLKSIRSLHLSGNNISTLPADVFIEMRRLEILELNANNLSALPDRIFDSLVSLNTLFLHWNCIHVLPVSIFGELRNLRYLNLGNNDLEFLSHHILSNLTKLLTLDLHHIKIKELGGLFSRNGQTRELYLMENVGLVLSNDSFEGLQKLNYLNLEKCDITSLPDGVFDSIRSLAYLRLSENQLQEITPGMFSALTKLTQLDLSFNDIVDLKDLPFKNNNKLMKLSLTENGISEIENDTFQGLLSLKQLDLSSNKIKRLDNCLSGLTRLIRLNISHNLVSHLFQFDPFQSLLSSMERLMEFDGSNNKIQILTNVFLNNTDLLSLDISKNPNLVLDNNSFNGLSKLKILRIDYCNIEQITPGIFANLPTLEDLNMQGNCLQQIDSETFTNLIHLRVLDVSYNEISWIEGLPFKEMGFLKSLSISNNKLREIKAGDFTGPPWLEKLDISVNYIENIQSKSFDSMSHLRFLNISHNKVSSLRDISQYCVDIREIDASHNRLIDIGDKNWSNLVKLERIRASYNKVEKVNMSLMPQAIINLEGNSVKTIYMGEKNRGSDRLSKREAITQIYLSENPIQCDCQSYKLFQDLRDGISLLQHVEFADDLICQHPADLRGKAMRDLVDSDFVCYITEFCPESCICKYRAYDEINILNCSDKGYQRLPLMAPSNSNVLHIERNSLLSLLHLNETIWENLTEIHADGNEITHEEFQVPKKLKYLGLSDNRLERLPDTVQKHAESVEDFNLTLSGNMWTCDCSLVPFKTFVSEHRLHIKDVIRIHCTFSDGTESVIPLKEMEYSDLCPYTQYVLTIILLSSLGVLVLTASITSSVLYYRHKMHILAYLYTHANPCYTLFCGRPEDEEKLFDCFISYSSMDREVAHTIVEELEDPIHCKFCIHERNWISGKFITTNIVDSIQNSRKTLIILSREFLKSEWFHMEFQAAYHQMLKDKKDRLILVLLGELPDKSEMENDLQYVISTKTYLEWGERWFWEKLRYSIHEEHYFISRKRETRFLAFLRCFRGEETIHEEFEINEVI